MWDTENKFIKVKVRYRGDYCHHWACHKKSFRVKTQKKSLFKGMRKFNLIRPKTQIINNYFSYKLAEKFGIIAPQSELVNLTINGKRKGLYLLAEQIEEITLRNNKLIPGDIYAGEMLAKDSYKGAFKNLFLHPAVWKKVASNNHYPLDSYKPLKHLFNLLQQSSSESNTKKLAQLFDMKSWGAYNAWETLINTFHYDELHNWRLYFDPIKSLFRPIIWDPVGLMDYHFERGKSLQLDIMPSTLHQKLMQNGDFLRARHMALENFFATKMDLEFIKFVDKTIKDITPAIYLDPSVFSAKKKLARVRAVKNSMKEVFSYIRRGYLDNKKDLNYVYNKENKTYAFSFSNRGLLKKLIINFSKPPHLPSLVKLRYWQKGQMIEQDITKALFVNNSSYEIKMSLLPRFVWDKNNSWRKRLKAAPSYYELSFSNTPSNFNKNLIDLKAYWGNGLFTQGKKVDYLKKIPFELTYNVARSKPLDKVMTFEKVMEIKGIKKIDKKVIILSGTKIIMHPKASLIFTNKVTALGTKLKPIKFIAKNGQKPWGTIALQGQEANSSIFDYCYFSGGSGIKGDLYEYSGMLSVHDVKDLIIKNSHFSNNHLVDDMIHIVYSDVKFINIELKNALFDAIDFDISKAIIEKSHFINSGNDAIDLMSSQVVVIDTLIENSKDKGISVGERAQLLAINTVLKNNHIAVQSKDSSIATLYNSNLFNNKLALHAYKKNWRYDGGGKTFVYKSKILENAASAKVDKHSNIKIYDTYIDKRPKNIKRGIWIDPTVDNINQTKTQNTSFFRFDEEKNFFKKIDATYWSKINNKRRGV